MPAYRHAFDAAPVLKENAYYIDVPFTSLIGCDVAVAHSGTAQHSVWAVQVCKLVQAHMQVADDCSNIGCVAA